MQGTTNKYDSKVLFDTDADGSKDMKYILLYIRAANMLGVTDTGPSLQELVHQYRYIYHWTNAF